MDDVGRDAQLEQLMSELSWLKRLATALVRNESDADDLVQETFLVAAEHAPKDGRPLKPWLSRVALNVVRMRSRASKRRVARETAAGSLSEKPSTPPELVSRVAAQRIVVDAVLALAEPYRSTVLLHYFDEVSSAEIARRLGIPEGTVRRRLKTGLDELRARLHAEELKTGRAVIAVLAPAAFKQAAASAVPTALGVVLMKKAIAIVVLAVGLLFLGVQLYRQRDSTTDAAVASRPQVGSIAARRQLTADNTALAHVIVSVADDAGPIADAIVRCAPADGDVVVFKTGTDGNAVIDIAAGEWSFAASAIGHEPRRHSRYSPYGRAFGGLCRRGNGAVAYCGAVTTGITVPNYFSYFAFDFKATRSAARSSSRVQIWLSRCCATRTSARSHWAM